MLDSILLRIAKSSILHRLDDSYSFDENLLLEKYPFLKRDAASFVTLKYDKNLRGCIGSLNAYRSTLDDVSSNAVSAAFGDPRFEPLHDYELSHLSLEVSILSEPSILDYTDFDDLCKKVRPHIDGLILKHGAYRGTFLPQVWEQLSTPELFLEHLSMKAGANVYIYNEHPTIYRYSVDSLEENFDEVLPL